MQVEQMDERFQIKEKAAVGWGKVVDVASKAKENAGGRCSTPGTPWQVPGSTRNFPPYAQGVPGVLELGATLLITTVSTSARTL